MTRRESNLKKKKKLALGTAILDIVAIYTFSNILVSYASYQFFFICFWQLLSLPS